MLLIKPDNAAGFSQVYYPAAAKDGL